MSSESRDQTFIDKMSAKVLEERIIEFLKEQNMCVLATCGDGLPRATPIEYRSKGITIYFVGEPGTKLKNITNNPNVSIGIFFPYKGWNSAKGAQITGRAKIIYRQDPDSARSGFSILSVQYNPNYQYNHTIDCHDKNIEKYCRARYRRTSQEK